MKVAIAAAGFTPTEANGLRRAMATFRRFGTIHGFRDKFIDGMLGRGYERDFAERCFKQIEGFADYGFPESHAASFALIVYVSSWLKRHHPAAFAAALLNSQPMGFYAPAQIVGDARDHGVEVRPVDVSFSDWDCTLEPSMCDGGAALRLGFRQVKGLAEEDAEAIVAARGDGFCDTDDVGALARRAGLDRRALELLAGADAFGSLGVGRRDALWAVRGLGEAPLPLFAAAEEAERGNEPAVTLPQAALGEQVADDYRAVRLSLKAHPLTVLRDRLAADGFRQTAAATAFPHDRRVKTAGLVVTRQRPGSASGVIFITLEDESGHANLIVWPKVFERFRKTVLQATLIGISGPVQREGAVVHILAERLWDLDPVLGDLTADLAPSRADEAKFEVYSRDFH